MIKCVGWIIRLLRHLALFRPVFQDLRPGLDRRLVFRRDNVIAHQVEFQVLTVPYIPGLFL